MIVNNTAQPLISNNEPSKEMNFGISDVRLVVDLLSKLYAHPIQTLVQEYICNGRDAMRENGTWGKTPIDISVPNTFEPTFKVRDYGCGISPDRMENVFVNYGSSTKRATNTQTGGFGIGAKSAFSYTDSFTITSFVDGIKYVYVAHLGDNGGVNLIEQVNTKEANGVEISIGVKSKDVSDFRDAVQRCVMYWTEEVRFFGVVDGEIKRVKPLFTLDNMSVYTHENGSDTFYLIDGIKYPKIGDSHQYGGSRIHSYGYSVAVVLPNGFFKIASSRERLENNQDNQDKEKELLNGCINKILKLKRDTLDNPSLKLQEKIQAQVKYKAFDIINDSVINLGTQYKLRGNLFMSPSDIKSREIHRTRRGKVIFLDKAKTNFNTTTTVVIDTSKENEPNTLPRRLNHYLTSNLSKQLMVLDDPTKIPFLKELFPTIIDSTTMPKPVQVKGVSKTRSAGGSYVYRLRGTTLSDQMETVSIFNKRVEIIVVVESLTAEAVALMPFLKVYRIPKANRSMITRKTMTVEQGKKYLLAENKKDMLGLSLSFGEKQVKALANLGVSNIASNLRAYLYTIDASLKTKQEAIEKEYARLKAKYPLLEVMGCVHGHYEKIVIEELNKQMKGEL